MSIAPQSAEALSALALGFAFAGMLANGFQLATGRALGFRLLEQGGAGALASIPFLVFSAPFLIVSNTVRGAHIERRPTLSVMLATMLACGWSLLSGRLVLDAAHLLGAA